MRLNNLKLQQKGLILVLIPLVFELSLVFTLVLLLKQSDHELWKETHARLMVDGTNELLRQFYDAGASLFMYHSSANELFLHRYSLSVSTIKEQVDKIKVLLKDNPKESQALRRVETVTNKGLSLMEGSSNLDGKPVNVAAFFRAQAEKKDFQNIIDELIRALQELSQEQRATRHVNPKEGAFLRSLISGVLVISIAFSLILALALAYFFSRNIAGRLKILQENSRRLSRQESLSPQIGGKDEIAELDAVFHEMAGALAAAQKKERAVIENAIDVIFSVDTSNRFLTVNQACRQMWGLEANQICGQSLESLVSSNHLEAVLHAFSKTKSQQDQAKIELLVENKNGTRRWNEWSLHYVESEKTIFCVAHDISERKELEAMKQDFFAMVSHDLRSPLTSIYGSLELASAGAFGEPPALLNKEIGFAINNLQRLIRLINDLLDLEKMSQGKMSLAFDCFELNGIVKRSFEAVKMLFEAKQLKFAYEDQFIELFCDRDRLIQVIINLLSNAIKYSPEGGTISINCQESADFLRIEIKDDGPGIPEEKKASIFDRYEQVGRQSVGTGLGLAICKLIVEEHKGEIGVESAIGKGSTFWFTVPVSKDN